MKRIPIWLIVAAALVIAALVYRSRSSGLNVTPEAGRAIEKAKNR